MAQMTMIQALRSAMDVMLDRNPDVVVFGEDVGYFGGVFRCTEGLQAKYGTTRVFDTPISEGGIVGVAVGVGAYGLRPVAEIQFADRSGSRQIILGPHRAVTLHTKAGEAISEVVSPTGTFLERAARNRASEVDRKWWFIHSTSRFI
jgi:pyruvate/2-oxoglutarate/acetoin dehydrogenase E1 component